jgi:hypothetical protein
MGRAKVCEGNSISKRRAPILHPLKSHAFDELYRDGISLDQQRMIGVVAIDLVYGTQISVLVLWQAGRRWKDLKDFRPHGVPHCLDSAGNGRRGHRSLGERLPVSKGSVSRTAYPAAVIVTE